MALRPHLASVPTILYFHENQLAYPNRPAWTGERDHHFGMSQMIAALVADRCVFNSAWNRDSFLAEGDALLKKMPDAIPRNWMSRIALKASVLPIPLDLPTMPWSEEPAQDRSLGPIIVWNHRWEHDKAPEVFF